MLNKKDKKEIKEFVEKMIERIAPIMYQEVKQYHLRKRTTIKENQYIMNYINKRLKIED